MNLCGIKMDQQQEFTPRPYQISLYEKAVAENSIIYLPTGAGKTYIAVLVIAKLSGPLHKPYTVDGKRTIFLVNTVALVQQQSNFLARHTGLMVKGYTGDQHVDRWSKEKWLQEITSSRVMVMTAQIFLDLLEHGIMPLVKVNLLIFDECHHAVKDHPMKQIMRRFENWPVDQHPRVLGLSACLLNANIASINHETTVKDLEATFQAKVITVENLATVSVFSTKPKEVLEYYDPLKENNIISEIFNLLTQASEQLRILDTAHKHSNHKMRSESKTIKLARMLSDIIEQIKETGLNGGLKSIILHMIKIDCIRKSPFEEVSPYMNFYQTQLMKVQKLIYDSTTGIMSQDFSDSFLSPKVLKLVEVLKKIYCMQKKKQEFCCIIFVKRRFTAKIVYHILKDLNLQDKSLNFLKPDYIVGQNSDPKINAREKLCLSKWNKEVLQKFKNGIINCLVATDVVDEGIDVPKCTLVVRFHAPMDFRSYIQSKGRARHSTSNFVVLVRQRDYSYLRRYDEYQKTEKTLQEALHSQIIRQAPTAEEIDQRLYDYDIEPYVITLENDKKSVITEQNAISLINMYCSSLSSSRYSTIMPIWRKEHDQNPFRIHLTLPVKSPLQDTIASDYCTSIDAAKRSAAFKACVKLYEIGELDDNLLPKSKVTVGQHAESLFPHMQSQNSTTTNMKRKYLLTYPKAWFGAYPQVDTTLYLHIIEMIPSDHLNLESSSETPKSSFYNTFATKNTYGILSTKKLPEIPMFPIFTNDGVFQINVKINNLVSPLTDFEINQMKQFHYLIFNEILGVSKDFMIFDADNRENCFLVVPVNGDQQIDWDVVRDNERISTIQPSKPMELKASDYRHQLILPTYRVSSIYFVTEVCSEIKAKSPFDTDAYDSYADYFEKKHNLIIKNLNQPMLKVRPLSKEMNWLKPRIGKTPSSHYELLVPELCQKITLPTVYWLKATTLPSILHRISQLLVAEDLRVKIASQAGLNIDRTLTAKWDPLIITEGCEQSLSSDNNITSNDSILSNENLNSSTSWNVTAAIETNVFSVNKRLYTWAEEQEPLDLERNADILTPQDLDYYNTFMNRATLEDKANWEHHNSSTCNYSFSERKQEPPLQMLTRKSAHGPSPVDILQSLTAKTSNDIINYERLETLGDAFLKYAVSLFLYQNYPSYGERLLTELKGKMVSNSNFYGCGQITNLAGKMNVKEFTPNESCIVPSFGVDPILKELVIKAEMSASVLHDVKIPRKERFSGIMSKDTVKRSKERFLNKINHAKKNTAVESFLGLQDVSEKCISDCVEAVIGIYLARLGVEDALKVVKWFEILPKTASVECLINSGIQDPRRTNGPIDQYMPWASIIEERIGYTFRDRAFLLQALTHQTFTSNRITDSYERLEFLGDAVLDFLLTVYIYEACGNLNPGELTDLRSAFVNNITFACLTVRYGLHTALLSYSPELFRAIDQFVQFQESRNYKVDDELFLVLSEEDGCNMSEHVDVPKALGDIFESVIGAVYLDSAKNLRVTWHVVYNLMKEEIGAFSSNVPKQPIRVLHETIGVNPIFSAPQQVEGSINVMVSLTINDAGERKHFHGFAPTTKLAKCAASKQALKYLRSKK